MASSSNGSWETDLRDSVRTNFGQGWLVNGERSGKTKILYVYNEGLGKANKRTSVTLPIKAEAESTTKTIFFEFSSNACIASSKTVFNFRLPSGISLTFVQT